MGRPVIFGIIDPSVHSMYCEYFGFREAPFNITPDPRFIFLSKNHQEAFAHLLYGIQQHSGFIEVIGEVGSGKTTVLRALLNQLDEERYRTALIFNPCLSADELLASINREYGLPADSLSPAMLLEELNRFLLEENAAGRTVVLVIDEAQNLSPQVLEQIRLISNLETESDKLIQIVLAGQPELGRLLQDPQLRQLSQRITVRYQLLPMDFNDTCSYISHRMELAGGWRAAAFEQGALKRIYRHTGGLPRLINVVCDRALLIAFTVETRTVNARMARDAIREITRGGQGRKQCPQWVKPAAITAGLCVVAGAALFALPLDRIAHRASMTKPAAVAAGKKPDSAPPVAKTVEGELASTLGNAQKGLSESDSAIQAYNALGKLWHVKQLRPTDGVFSGDKLGRAAAAQGLRIISYKGTLDQLVKSDYPAILQVTIPGVTGHRYVALTGLDGGKPVLEPSSNAPKVILSTAELQGLWSGKAYLMWKNFLEIPPVSLPDTKGEHIRLIQLLLQKTGHYGGRLNGIFDGTTIEALKAFQQAQGEVTDGKVSEQTLLLLYRNAGGFDVPRLQRKG